MSTSTMSHEPSKDAKGFGSTVPFDKINDPGAYICNWSGHLLRVPDDAIKPGRSVVVNFMAKEPLLVTKISDNPFVTVTKARMLAADHDLEVNF